MIDLNPNHLRTVKRLLAEYVPECEVRAFGSRVTWTAKDYSDLDLAVVGEQALAPDVLRRLKEAFEESELPFRVDVLDWHGISATFRKVIEGQFEVVQKGSLSATDLVGLDVMPSGWPWIRLGDFVTLQRGHDLPEHQRQPGRVPVLGSFGVTGYHDTPKAKGPGVTVGRSGASFGVVTYSPVEYWPLNTALYVIDFHGNDERFAYYLLKSLDFSRYNSGSAQASLNRNFIHPIQIAVPPAAEQRAIAHILGTLDDKIELNRRLNDTLEAMARALFQSWFVDFDPVRAKAEGRDPGLPQPLADLFPDSFEGSELGEIPKGWEVGPLGRFIKVGLGGAWGDDSESSRAAIAIRCLRGIDCHDFAEGRIPDVPIRWVSPGQAADRQLVDGTILVEGSGSFCGRSLLWRANYGELFDEPICYSNFCKRLDPLCTPAQATVCWLQMRQAYRSGELQAFRTGTAFPNFDIHGALANLIVVMPPEPVADAFGKFFRLSQRFDLMAQARTVGVLRDTLLPKLISGEVWVGEAERSVTGVGA